MNLQINLFSEESLTRKSERRFSTIRNTKFELSDSVPKEILLDYAMSSRDDIYARSIKYGLSNNRSHEYILGANIDSHFNLEAMNVSKRSKGFIVVYSINTLLPLVLAQESGCDLEKLLNIEFIDEISDAILNLNFEKNLYLDYLSNVDEKLDSYLATFFLSSSTDIDCLKTFVSRINYCALNILKYIMSYLETYSNMIVLSVDKSRILLSSEESEAPSLDVSFLGQHYKLNPFITNELNGFHNSNVGFNFCEVI